MRVIRPRDFEHLKKPKRQPRKKGTATILFVVTLLVLGWFIRAELQTDTSSHTGRKKLQNNQTSTEQTKTQQDTLKTFSGEEFKVLAQGVRYPNNREFTVLPSITGEPLADHRIRTLAEQRGYRLTSIPVAPIEKINEPRLDGDDLLQPLAAQAWRSLKAAAKRDGMPLALLSAYRSPEYQRDLFSSRLRAAGATPGQVAAGTADDIVERVLKTAAIPGYSRHHNGYTIDLWCEDGSTAFLRSRCFAWMSADNYKIAKENGWIPSYPEGTDLQGPEPEPWEYVWAGREHLYE